jgi:hypothetical protein
VFAAEIDKPGDLSADRIDRREGRQELCGHGDGVVPDVCVRYVRWRISRAALAFLPVARGADLLLHSAQINVNNLARYLVHHGQVASWHGMRLWQETRMRAVRGYRVHKFRFRKLRRAVAAQGHQYIAAVRQPLSIATWVGGNLFADARFRTQRRYRLQRIRVRLLRRAVEAQVLSYVRAARKPVVSGEQLRVALDRHEAWVASGWEVGKRADLHQFYLRRANLSWALLADADLHGADLIRADLREADLEGADLHKAKLRRANLHRAELRWADLRQADLSRADLEGADLKDADLHHANLRGAKLSNAVFEHADLRGANLSRAKGLTQAQIDVATANAETRLPRGLKIGSSIDPGTSAG